MFYILIACTMIYGTLNKLNEWINDETMDAARPVVHFAVAQYVNKNSTEDKLLLCKPLKTQTTGEDIFNLVDLYLKKEGPSWEECIDTCNDGVRSDGVRRIYISFKSLVNDFVYSFGRAALLLLVEVQNHTVPIRERRRIRDNIFIFILLLSEGGVTKAWYLFNKVIYFLFPSPTRFFFFLRWHISVVFCCRCISWNQS